MATTNSADLRQQNLDIILSGDVERNIQAASKVVPDDTFTVLSKEQLLKLISLGVEIPLRSQTTVLHQIEPRFLDNYAGLARYTPEQIAEKTVGKYFVAEEIMQTTWSFWFDYLQKLKKELAAKDENEFRVIEASSADSLTASRRLAEDTLACELANDVTEQDDIGHSNLSEEALELVDDVWAEFEKAGMDK